MVQVRTTLDMKQLGLPAAGASLELNELARLDSAEKNLSRRSVLKDIQTRINVRSLDDGRKSVINAHGKAFKISPSTTSLTDACISPECFSRVT